MILNSHESYLTTVAKKVPLQKKTNQQADLFQKMD